MRIETKIKIIQDDAGQSCEELTVANHTAWRDRIILKFGDSEVQVRSQELLKALQNAMNQ